MLAPAGVATLLSRFGSAEQQATYLPAFLGEDVPRAALAVLEAGSRTTARRDGDRWLLSGEKALVPHADLLLVAAEEQLFIVEGGFSARPEPAMGVRAAATERVTFEDVPGELLDADYTEVVDRARLAWCALACGTARAVLDYVIPYVNERRAFGEPISHRQAVAFTVADIAIEAEAMRLLTLRAASLLDQGADASHAVAVAHRFCADKGAWIGSNGVQLLGGHGYVKEHPVERWYRDLRAIGVMEGALAV